MWLQIVGKNWNLWHALWLCCVPRQYLMENEPNLNMECQVTLWRSLPPHSTEGQNYKVYTDNYFTCVPLVVQLLDHGIHYVGKARQVHLPNCNLGDEKILKQRGRVSFDIRVEANHNICAVKWYNNRAVTLVSSFTGIETAQKIQCWNKPTKSFTEVERPYILGTYNKYMGGVDLLDSSAAKYKFPMKPRCWHIYIFWHSIILAVINVWLLYKWDYKALDIPKKRDAEQETISGATSILSHPGKNPFQLFTVFYILLIILCLMNVWHHNWFLSNLIQTNTAVTTPRRGRPSSASGRPLASITVTPQGEGSSSYGDPPNKVPAKRSCELEVNQFIGFAD